MKTLTQTFIVLVVFGILATAFAQAQTSQPVTQSPTPSVPMPAPNPTPSPPVLPTLPSSGSVDLAANDIFSSISFGSRTDNTGTVLVIPSEQTTTQDLITINEDMNVMSRIFEKNLEQERVTAVSSGIFIPGRRERYGALLGSSRGQIQSMYLQGFGALFLLKVDFPLSPPPDVQEEEQETQKAEQGDPVWTQIKQELYEPEKISRERRTDRPESKYDAEKVENLKTTLIKALKHAANIRSLKPDESVILTAVGSGESSSVSIVSASGAPGQIVVVEKGPDGTKTQRVVQGNSLDALDNIGLSSPTVLVIRTKKSDIDEFAKGDLDFEKFRQSVQLLTYPLLGGADGHGSHFSPYMQFRSTGTSNVRR
jgi:hypothetical protein